MWTSLLRTSARPAFAALAAMGVSVMLNASAGAGGLALHAVIFTATYALCWIVVPGGRALLHENFWAPFAERRISS